MKDNRMKWWIGGLVVVLLAGICQSPHAEQGATATVDDIMQAKLKASQDLLAGLTDEDYDEITLAAEQLRILSLDAGWQVLQTPDYARHSADFARAAERVKEAGQQENLDGAVLGYVELTLSCVACHQYVRDQGQGRPAPAGD